jgi:flagellar protein FliO/FliZ
MLFLIAQGTVAVASPDLMPSISRMLIGLTVVLGLLGGLAWLLRRTLLVKRNTGGLGVESALALGERRSLVVVSVEGRRLLLGLAPNHVSLVMDLGARPSFTDAVNSALSKEPAS